MDTGYFHFLAIRIMLQGTSLCTFLDMFSFLLGKYLRVELLGHTVTTFDILKNYQTMFQSGCTEPLWRTVWRFLKLKLELPYDPAIPLLGMYPDKTIIQKDTCTPKFLVALFTTAKTWNVHRQRNG